MTLEFGKNLKGLGTLFNSFRKSETKDDAIQDIWGRVTEFSKSFVHDKIDDTSELGQLAQSVANSFIVTAGSALLTGAETEGLSLIPALIDTVMTGVLDWWTEADKDAKFSRGQWVSVITGFKKHSVGTSGFGLDMNYNDDEDEVEVPVTHAAFYIKTQANGTDCSVFDVQDGKVKTVAVTNVRPIQDQGALDDNEFLRDLKLLYFKEAGPDSVAKTFTDIAVGKDVMFADKLWEVLEFDPVKKIVSIVRDNKLVKTAIDAIDILDGDKTVTEFSKSTNCFPNTIEKFGFAWLTGGSDEELCCVATIYGDKACIYFCSSGEKKDVDSKYLRKISDKFKNTIINVPEFRRFRGQIIRGRHPIRVWSFRHLCSQSNMTREMDTMEPKTVEKEFKFLMNQFQSIDDDLYEKQRELELAYNEAFDIVNDEVEPVNF